MSHNLLFKDYFKRPDSLENLNNSEELTGTINYSTDSKYIEQPSEIYEKRKSSGLQGANDYETPKHHHINKTQAQSYNHQNRVDRNRLLNYRSPYTTPSAVSLTSESPNLSNEQQNLRSRNLFASGVYTLLTLQNLVILLIYCLKPKSKKYDLQQANSTQSHLAHGSEVEVMSPQVMCVTAVFLYLATLTIFFNCTSCMFYWGRYILWIIPFCANILLTSFFLSWVDEPLVYGALIYLIVIFASLAIFAGYFRIRYDVTTVYVAAVVAGVSILFYDILMTFIQEFHYQNVIGVIGTCILTVFVACFYTFDVHRVARGRYVSRIKWNDFVFGYFCTVVDIMMIPFDACYILYKHHRL